MACQCVNGCKCECPFCLEVLQVRLSQFDTRLGYQIWADTPRNLDAKREEEVAVPEKVPEFASIDGARFYHPPVSETLFDKVANNSKIPCSAGDRCMQRELLDIAFSGHAAAREGKPADPDSDGEDASVKFRMEMYKTYLDGIKEMQTRRTALNSLFLTIHSGFLGAMFLIMKEVCMPKNLYVDSCVFR